MAKGRKRKTASGDVATNRQASYRYNLLERIECGIVLTGTEVKSLREGNAQLKDSYATIRDGEVWLIGLYIAPYGPAARDNHDPERPRKLLLHRGEIERLQAAHPGAGADPDPDADLLLGPAITRQGRARARQGQGPATTSASRSASARWPATCSASCARWGADGAEMGSTVSEMTIGTSILLIAVGAILKWAVTAHVSWIDLQTAGTVLFLIGILGLILSVAYTFYWSRSHARANTARSSRRPLRPRSAVLAGSRGRGLIGPGRLAERARQVRRVHADHQERHQRQVDRRDQPRSRGRTW